MRTKHNRKFAGIWIPTELWNRDDLCISEKILLAEISNLDRKDGCFASNKYLADILKVSVSRIEQMLKRLKDKHLIAIEKFNDATRVIRCSVKISLPDSHNKLEEDTHNKLWEGPIMYYGSGQEKIICNSLENNDLQNENKSLYYSIYKKIKKYIKKEKTNFIELFPEHFRNNPSFVKTWNDWVIFRKELGWKLVKSTVSKQVLLLTKHSVEEAINCIERSITMGYRGLFFPKYSNSIQCSKQKKVQLPNPLSKVVFKLSGNNFSNYNWENLLTEHKNFYNKISFVLKGRHKDFLEERLSSCDEMIKRFSNFILEKYSDFHSIEPQMLRPTGKIFQKFISEEFSLNNIPISIFKGEVTNATIYSKKD